MAQLIDDLLELSRVTRHEIRHDTVDLSTLARAIAAAFQRGQSARDVRVEIAPGLLTRGDARLLQITLENLFGNAWKFTGQRQHAIIGFGTVEEHLEEICRPISSGMSVSEVAPGIKRILVLVDTRDVVPRISLQFLLETAPKLGIELVRRDVTSDEAMAEILNALPMGAG